MRDQCCDEIWIAGRHPPIEDNFVCVYARPRSVFCERFPPLGTLLGHYRAARFTSRCVCVGQEGRMQGLVAAESVSMGVFCLNREL